MRPRRAHGLGLLVLLIAVVLAVAQPTRDGRLETEPTTARVTTPLTVVGLGDSVPAATACDCTSYVSLVGLEVAGQEGRTARIDNLARAGLTSGGLLQQLTGASARAALRAADLVIVTIGANDFDPGELTSSCPSGDVLSCYTATLATLRANLAQVLTEIRSLQPAGARTLVTGYWNDFLDGAVGQSRGRRYVRTSNEVTLASNQVTAQVSSAQAAEYVDIYTPFKGSDDTKDCTALLAPDGDHPNAAGHRLIATTLVRALQPA